MKVRFTNVIEGIGFCYVECFSNNFFGTAARIDVSGINKDSSIINGSSIGLEPTSKSISSSLVPEFIGFPEYIAPNPRIDTSSPVDRVFLFSLVPAIFKLLF